MEFFRNILDARPRIEKTIQKYGYATEHNYHWYQYCSADRKGKSDGILALSADGSALLTQENDRINYVFSEPLANGDRRQEILEEYLEYVFAKTDVKKVSLELNTGLRKKLLANLPSHLRASATNYTLEWPVMNLEKFDLALPGGHFKHIRNARSKFYREHKVEIKDARQVEKKELEKIVDDWKKQRGAKDRTWSDRYYNMIENGFAGTQGGRAMVVDGEIHGFNAGWLIPNSQRYYGAVGLHDYSYADLGLMIYLEDLEWMKKQGFKEADMGGGEKALTNFKNQFNPESFYKTHVFSVVRK